MTQPMKPSKAPTMWERYQSRPARKPDQSVVNNIQVLEDLQGANSRLMREVMEILNDHAANIDALKSELKETKEFMDWAITTHEGILNEYNAVKDVVAATGSDASFNKLLEDWAKS
jgi:hypothetical protein